MYFFFWRPEGKKRKALEQKRSAMQKGDEIVILGIVGTLEQIKEKTIIVKMVDGVSRLEMLKEFITEVNPLRIPNEIDVDAPAGS